MCAEMYYTQYAVNCDITIYLYLLDEVQSVATRMIRWVQYLKNVLSDTARYFVSTLRSGHV